MSEDIGSLALKALDSQLEVVRALQAQVAELVQERDGLRVQVDEAKNLMAEMDDASARDDWAEACLAVLERMMKFVNRDTKA
jgi:hypothetical protein